MSAAAGCSLCSADGGTVVVRAPLWRIVRADEPGLAGFYRVIWNRHVREFSDLPAAERALCLDTVVRVEEALRRHLQPTKVNLATLGNAVPHLHWHVIARFEWDSHFPGAVWAGPLRQADAASLEAARQREPALEAELRRDCAGA